MKAKTKETELTSSKDAPQARGRSLGMDAADTTIVESASSSARGPLVEIDADVTTMGSSSGFSTVSLEDPVVPILGNNAPTSVHHAYCIIS